MREETVLLIYLPPLKTQSTVFLLMKSPEHYSSKSHAFPPLSSLNLMYDLTQFEHGSFCSIYHPFFGCFVTCDKSSTQMNFTNTMIETLIYVLLKPNYLERTYLNITISNYMASKSWIVFDGKCGGTWRIIWVGFF